MGLGSGVADMLRAAGHTVQELNAGARARDADRRANARSEGYWRLRDMLERGELALPQEPELGTT